MNGDELPPEVARALAALVEFLCQRVAQAGASSGASTESAEPSPWLSVASAAAYLDWPKGRLYKLTASGEIPHYKQDGRLLFRRDELDAWLQQFAQGERDWLTGGGRS